jgi:predicted Rossmann fold nucleotide-binding protein DprA/Smf involved in DNA uptake
MTEKMTHATALTMAIALLTSDTADHSDIIEHLEALRASLDKRAERAKSAERKPSAKQMAAREEAAKLAESTFVVMQEKPDFLYECKPLAEQMGVSTPKMARLLAALVEQGKVKRIEGKKPTFQVVKGE